MTVAIFVLTCAILGSLAFMVLRFRVHRMPSIVGVTFLTLFVMHGVTAVPYAMGRLTGDYSYDVPVSPHFPWVIAGTFAFYALGAFIGSVATGFDLPRRHREFFARPLEQGAVRPLVYVLATGAALVISAYYAYGAGGQTGLAVVSSQTREGEALREFRLGFQEANPYYYVGILTSQIFGPILMLVAANRARIHRSMLWAAVALILFLMNALAATAQLHKLPLVLLLLLLLLDWMQGGKNFQAASSRFFAISVAIVAGLASVGYYLTYDIGAGESFQATLERVFLVPQTSVDWFLYVYPKMIDYNHGLGIGLIAKLAGVKNYVNPPFLVSEIVTGEPFTSINGVWSTEFWAMFGYPGVILGSVGVGALMVLLDRWCLERARTATAVALYSFLVVAAIKIPSVSIFTGLLSGGVGLGPLFVWLVLERRQDARPRARAGLVGSA